MYCAEAGEVGELPLGEGSGGGVGSGERKEWRRDAEEATEMGEVGLEERSEEGVGEC